MRLSKTKYLLDVNVLIALTDEVHTHYQKVNRWFNTPGLDWGLCAFTEAGFLRLATNTKVGAQTMQEATAILADLATRTGYRFWPITATWTTLAKPFTERLFGHQQVTDAFLLGLAIQENGTLVTLDKAMAYLAGPRNCRHVLVLE
jgi:hypothetical protein